MVTTVIVAAAVAAVAVLSCLLISSRAWGKRKDELEEIVFGKEKEIVALQAELRHKDELLQHMHNTEEALQKQIAAIKTELLSESEKVLKEREKELDRRASENFEHITGSLGKDLKDMKEAFEKNKETQSTSVTELRTNIETAVRALAVQTSELGGKADNLAEALRGKNKMQGCWGETILGNIFRQEGLVEGRDFDQEFTIRDEMGMVVANEDTGRRMRPDFVLHFPDDTDILVDSKVSLGALSDWYAAENEEQRADAARRNLDSVKAHIKELAGKDYSRYLPAGKKSMDYVVMFIPNYASLQLAKNLEPNLFAEAFQKGVLLTTEETIMPFLRMIRTAWVNVEQVRNQQQIITSAQNMIDRVHDFAASYAAVGKKMEEAFKEYEKGDAKLRDSGASIITSAKQLIKLGIPENPKKPIQ